MLYLHWWFHSLGQWSRKFKFHLCWHINLIKQHALHNLHNSILCRRKVAAGASNPFVKMRVTAKLEKIFSSVLRIVWNRSEVRGTWSEKELQCLKIRNGNIWEKNLSLKRLFKASMLIQEIFFISSSSLSIPVQLFPKERTSYHQSYTWKCSYLAAEKIHNSSHVWKSALVCHCEH